MSGAGIDFTDFASFVISKNLVSEKIVMSLKKQEHKVAAKIIWTFWCKGKVGNSTSVSHGDLTVTPQEAVNKIRSLEWFTGSGNKKIDWDTISLQTLLRKCNGGFHQAFDSIGKDKTHAVMIKNNDLYKKLADGNAFTECPDWFIQRFATGQNLKSEEWLTSQFTNIGVCYGKIDTDKEYYYADYFSGCFFLLCRIYGKKAEYLPAIDKALVNNSVIIKVSFRRQMLAYFFADEKGWLSKQQPIKTKDHPFLKRYPEKFKDIIKDIVDAKKGETQADFNAYLRGSNTKLDDKLRELILV